MNGGVKSIINSFNGVVCFPSHGGISYGTIRGHAVFGSKIKRRRKDV